MTLKDFEEHIEETILNRGLDYFHEENVDNLEKVASGMWLAHVYGSETYTVEVRTHRTQIKSWDCNCPYDHGPVCKHAVAVFYAILQELESRKTNPKKVGTKKKSVRKDKVAEIFKKIGQKDLEGFILSQFRAQPGLKNAFIAHFADLLDEDLETKYRTIVRNIYRSVKDRYGYIDYRSTPRLVKPLQQLINNAEVSVTEKNYREALAIGKTLIEEVPVYLLNMDSSDGSAGYLVDSAFDIFYEIAKNAHPMLKDELFEYCIAQYPKEKYSNFGFESNFLETLPLLITLKEQEEQFFALLDRQIERARKDNYSEYRLVGLIKTKIFYLKKAKRVKEADVLVEANKEHAEFREMLLENAVAKKDFEQAKTLCQEAISIEKGKGYRGRTNRWYNKLLYISEKEKNIADIRKWSEKLYFDSYYQKEYYKKLKATYTGGEWNKKCEALINKIKGSRTHASHNDVMALADIYVAEKEWEKLLKQLQANTYSLSVLDKYSPYLIEAHPEEMVKAFETAVKKNAEETGRSIYNETARYLKKMEKMEGGSETVGKTLRFFRDTYKNRRAMMEVLDKKFKKDYAR